MAIVLFAELHTDTGGAVALRADRRDPDDLAGDRDLFRVIHQREQHEHLLADAIFLLGGHEQAAALEKRHVGRVQGTLVLDGE